MHITLKRLLLGVNADMDLEAVGGEEGLPTAQLITHKCVLAPVRLLVRSQVSRRAVRPGAAFEHALVALHLEEEEDGGDISAMVELKIKIQGFIVMCTLATV